MSTLNASRMTTNDGNSNGADNANPNVSTTIGGRNRAGGRARGNRDTRQRNQSTLSGGYKLKGAIEKVGLLTMPNES